MKKLVNLTYPQKAILLTENFYKNTAVNNICGTAIIDSVLDFDALNQAINTVVKENDVFRITLTKRAGEIKQFKTEYKETNFEVIDIKDKSEVCKIEDALMKKAFNILDSDLYVFKMFRFENGCGGFLLNIHHIISDGWTLGLVCRKIMKAYSDIKNNELKEENIEFSYLDYAENESDYINSEKFIKDKKYWEELFNGEITPAILPSDNSEKSAELSCLGERLSFSISKSKMKLINEYCLKNKLTVFNFLMAIYSIYISKIINSTDFSIGTPILNRTNFKEKNIAGMFVNVVPFRVQINPELEFIEFAKSISEETVGLLRHQKYPYQLLLEELRKKDSSIPNLYNIVLSYQITKANNETEYKYSTRWAFNKHATDDISIQFLDLDEEGSLTVSYDFKKLKYSEEYIKSMNSRIFEMINKILETDSIIIKDIEIITKQEKNKILNNFNDTIFEYNKNKNVIKAFKEMVRKYPDKTAIVFENRKMTYKELDEKSNILAMTLKENGANPKNIIGICVNRSLELAVGLLAILKINCAYLPIDPEYPEERIEYMLSDSNAQILLTNKRTENIINNSKIKKIDIGLESSIYNRLSIEVEEKINPEDLIYLIYTSGSTGKPKGVMLKHQNITNFLIGTKNVIEFNPEKVMASITTICFDIFVLEFWGALTSGMTLILANEIEQNNSEALNKICLENGATMIQTTPSRFKALLENIENTEFIKKMTDIMVGGEGIPKALVEKFENLTKANIFNMYGPTETAVWSTIKKVKAKDMITIGKPIANTKCYILDKDKNLLPTYTPGELYIGGDGVSNGYLNRKELTDEKFVESPFDKNELIYNTNDFAYFTNSGELVHLGRTDFQVKIRGYRVELEEIESKINKISGILNNVVIADENQKYLICYYIANEEIDTNKVSAKLLKDLPNYMIPAVFFKMNEFPLTPNGKLDRKKLPKIKIENSDIKVGKTKTEKILSKVISKVLEKEELDIDTPFLVLGLDSLGIIEVQTMLLQYNYNLNTQDFYKFTTIRSLAENIDSNIYTYKEEDAQVPIMMRHTFDELVSKADKKTNGIENLGNVFLTGANGFIGIHLLHELMKTTDSKVYCLVRSKKEQKAEDRLIEQYKFYFKENIKKLLGKRIFVVEGNISKDNIGLNNDDINKIKSEVKTLIHTAARVKHYGEYEVFNQINVEGTRNVTKFAFENDLRLIHTSSISVSRNYLVKQDNRNVEFSENNLYIGQNYMDNVYVHSKFEAEKIVLEYMEKGLKAQIHRIGILSGRYQDGMFQENITENAFYTRIKSMVVLGAVSEEMLKQKIEFTPVDSCCCAIIALAKNTIADNRIFHLYNHNFIEIEEIIDVLRKFNINIETVSEKELESRIIEISKSDKSQILFGIINDLNNTKTSTTSINYNFSVNIKSEFTLKYLKVLKKEWNRIDKNYIRKIVNYMRDVKFI